MTAPAIQQTMLSIVLPLYSVHMNPHTPNTLGGLISGFLARFLASRTGKVVAAIFIGLQVYLHAVVPAWQQVATLPGAWAKLENAEREADAARKLHTAEANRIAEEAKLRRAEAESALAKAKADAETKEAEADKAGAESIAAPELEKAIAEEVAARAKVLTGTAIAARDNAKSEADRVEAEAVQVQAKARHATALLSAEVAAAREKSKALQQSILIFIGPPLPDIFSLESDK